MFWVPAGIATIFAIKNAGLAMAIGTGSSCIVLVSFTWGIFVFGEHVHSRVSACGAVGCMMMGVVGMAYYSAPNGRPQGEEVVAHTEAYSLVSPASDNPEASPSDPHQDSQSHEEERRMTADDACLTETLAQGSDDVVVAHKPHRILFGVKWSPRTLGILSAMFSGIYGGSVMVPMKWAPDNARGSCFLISFAIGAATVNASLWIIRGLYLSYTLGSLSEGYRALPSLHLKKMWMYGATCGILWSIGNFFSILSVEFLGEGVGYSVVQASILGWFLENVDCFTCLSIFGCLPY